MMMMMEQKQILSEQERTVQPSPYGFSAKKIKTKQIEKIQLSLSLNSVTSQVDINKELSITGQVIGVRNSLGLFWWIAESKWNSQTSSDELKNSETSMLLPLNDFYNKSRLKTYQITYQKFVLVIKPETLSSSRSYRVVAEVCDIHTGEIAVSGVKFCALY
ncbi:hypothetical protein LSM04_008052 [Trypanosoma melophagium]|nr:hypothetical protein LSM04_008052 [Trypanosoma melophagium]